METKFLTPEDVIDFKRDTCLFCYSTFPTRIVREEVKEEARDGAMQTYSLINVLRRKHLVSELDIYTFDFKFDEQSEEALKEKEKEVAERAKKQKEGEIQELRKNLEAKFSGLNLPENQQRIAVDSIVHDCSKELELNGMYGKTFLEMRIRDYLFHNLKLGDLEHVLKRNGADIDEDRYMTHIKPRLADWDKILERYNGKNIGEVNILFEPLGLKSHKKCWPLNHFDGEVSFKIPYGEFFGQVMKNPRFEGFKELFKEFPGLLQFAFDLNVVLNARTYNPVDYL